MSQAGTYVKSGITPIAPVETLTGNTGGTVGPDGLNNIDIVTANTTVIFAGNPATHTLLQDFGAMSNLALGSSLPALAGGASNTALGVGSLAGLTSGISNTVVGYNSMGSLTSGAFNTAIGGITVQNLTTGSANIIMGYAAGSAYTTESTNIIIGNNGIAADNKAIRIGASTTTGIQLNNINSRFMSNYGTNNTFVGYESGNFSLTVLDATANTALGTSALALLTTGANNTAIGGGALSDLTTADNNVALGAAALTTITSGSGNTALGTNALTLATTAATTVAIGLDAGDSLLTGTENVLIGNSAGSNYTTSESNNICIGYNVVGTTGDDNAIRIGNSSATTCFIQGIASVAVSNLNIVTINTATGQLGSQSGSSTGFIQTITGNTGGAQSPSAGNFNLLTSNTTVKFAGSAATETLNFGLSNLLLGSSGSITSGVHNNALGNTSGETLTSGSYNTLIGDTSGYNFNTGNYNTMLGANTGTNYAAGESSNILLGYNVAGTLSENNVLRIGTATGTGNGDLNAAYIQGITSYTSVSNPAAVVINTATGQLGIGAGGGAPIEKIEGNDGTPESPIAGVFVIETANATVEFLGSAGTETLDFAKTSNLILGSTGAISSGTLNTGLGVGALFAITGGSANTCIGYQSGTAMTGAGANTCLGSQAGFSLTEGANNTLIGAGAGIALTTDGNNVAVGNTALYTKSGALGVGDVAIGQAALKVYDGLGGNTAVGNFALEALTTSVGNVAIGVSSGASLTGGGNNVIVGADALQYCLTGTGNTILGCGAATSYTSSEGNNIIIGNATTGVVGESQVLRIGQSTGGSGSGVLNSAYICGIDGVNLSTAKVVTESSNQLGTATITAGTGISVSSATANEIIISATGTTTLTVSTVLHAASPYTVLSTDEFISADVTAGVITIKLPNAPSTGRTYIIKDKAGLAGTSNITITTVGGSVTIDGATSYVMNTNYESISVIFDGSNYEVY